MSSQLNTLDHEIMSILLSARGGLSLAVLNRLSKQSRNAVFRSVCKLVELGFVSRRIKYGAKPFFLRLFIPPISRP